MCVCGGGGGGGLCVVCVFSQGPLLWESNANK